MQAITKLIHNIPVDPLTGAVSVPIYQTSTFVQEAPGVNKGFDYSRSGNPTRQTLEQLIASLEEGESASAFASGLAAIDAVIKLLKTGDEIVAVNDIYGGAFRLFNTIYNNFGITVHYVDTTDPENVLNAITDKTKLIWLESPTNPTLKTSDISIIAAIAKAHQCWLCVDNTFATPVYQRPIELGADIVVHSATKYLGGHSDLIAGLVITKTKELGDKIRYIQNACGAVLGPFDSWLIIRGVETLHLRMKQHSSSARQIAAYLNTQTDVKNVYYPGFGGIVSFTLHDDSINAATKFVTSTKLFKLAESLGGIKSLISHSASMTHKTIPDNKRRAAGVADSLIRLSVGLEEAEDLIEDLQQTFNTNGQEQFKLQKVTSN